MTSTRKLLFLLLNLCGIVLSQKKHIDFQLGFEVKEATIYDNDPLFYRIVVGDEYIEGDDIIIKVLPLDDVSDPDIYISKVRQ